MFIKTVWHIQRMLNVPQTLRELDLPFTRDAGPLGICGVDFTEMTASPLSTQDAKTHQHSQKARD